MVGPMVGYDSTASVAPATVKEMVVPSGKDTVRGRPDRVAASG